MNVHTCAYYLYVWYLHRENMSLLKHLQLPVCVPSSIAGMSDKSWGRGEFVVSNVIASTAPRWLICEYSTRSYIKHTLCRSDPIRNGTGVSFSSVCRERLSNITFGAAGNTGGHCLQPASRRDLVWHAGNYRLACWPTNSVSGLSCGKTGVLNKLGDASFECQRIWMVCKTFVNVWLVVLCSSRRGVWTTACQGRTTVLKPPAAIFLAERNRERWKVVFSGHVLLPCPVWDSWIEGSNDRYKKDEFDLHIFSWFLWLSVLKCISRL